MKFIKLTVLVLVTLFATNICATELKSSGRVMDSVNSITENLEIDEITTGTWVKSTEFSSVLIQIITDQDSADLGLEVQTRYSLVPTAIHTHAYTVLASPEGVHFDEALSGDEYRIVYTNGGTETTVFSLAASIGRTAVGVHMHPANHAFRENHPVQLNRSLIAGIKKDGTSGNVLITDHEALYVHPAVHDTPDISVHMVRLTGITDTTSTVSAKGDQYITVSNVSQWSAGNKIKIINSTTWEYDMFKVVSVGVPSTNDLTLDRPLDLGHVTGTDVIGVSQNMSVDGSTTPITFNYTPNTGKIVHIHTIHVTIESTGEPSLGLFGGQSPLTYGLHFKVKRTTGRDSTYWIPFRALNSMVLSGFVFSVQPKAGGTWFANLSLDLVTDSHTVISVDEAAGESFEATIRDDNNDGNTGMEIKLSIHEAD